MDDWDQGCLDTYQIINDLSIHTDTHYHCANSSGELKKLFAPGDNTGFFSESNVEFTAPNSPLPRNVSKSLWQLELTQVNLLAC